MTECLYPVLRTWVLEKSKLPLVISTPAVTSTSLLSFLWVSPIRIVNLGLEINRYASSSGSLQGGYTSLRFSL